MNIREYMRENVLILEGGMGTMLQARGLRPGEHPEMWNITHPEDVRQIHQAYYDAGSNVVSTNTFGANPLNFGAEELENLDGVETAILLIDGGGGAITRYGVVYDNGMKLDQIYDGKYFPDYYYEQSMLTVALTSRQEPENPKDITWIYLPAAKGQIERAMARSGITDPEDMRFRFAESLLPDEVDAALDFCSESIYDLNEMAMTVSKLSNGDWRKLGAVVTMAEPEYASQIRHLAENLDQFEFAPGVHTPAEYGKYMIQESGHFEYDQNLDEFYDYEKYGLQRMELVSGQFTDRGYISYHGTMSLDELMMEDPAQAHQQEQTFQMGGMSL